ncbi:MAG TPA: bifunctional demethylmenaquinone methyltransferase/2-methoxy-6-polyprenyl-1,4-benzoquinol methylase UbiE [Alphaproteobacteria bacterium]|nr:bifunctional demethylmenaquinone methyltransferase/2-methoxy-6-polyprenyl-1,4-benzoquinol methylase UbiE [Alphaproteobacteria bacterium]
MEETPGSDGRRNSGAAPPDSVPFGAADIPAAEKPARIGAVFESVAARYDLMNDLMSMGAHRLWKATCVDWLMPAASDTVLDVAGGTGDMAIRIARRAGGESAMEEAGGGVTVIDRSAPMMMVGQTRVLKAGLGRAIRFAAGDAEALPVPDSNADAYVIAFGLRNVTRPEEALEEAYRVLKPGGRFLCLEFSRPRWPLLKPVFERYAQEVLPRMGEAVVGDSEAYRYLAESIRRFANQERLAAMINAAGFGQVKVRDLAGGIAAIHTAWRL